MLPKSVIIEETRSHENGIGGDQSCKIQYVIQNQHKQKTNDKNIIPTCEGMSRPRCMNRSQLTMKRLNPIIKVIRKLFTSASSTIKFASVYFKKFSNSKYFIVFLKVFVKSNFLYYAINSI